MELGKPSGYEQASLPLVETADYLQRLHEE